MPSPETSKSVYALIFFNSNGRTKGYAFVYLKNAADVDKVIDFVDGRHIRNR